ncbi:hypothetical protein KI387_002858, partial [Taxus chinensis]
MDQVRSNSIDAAIGKLPGYSVSVLSNLWFLQSSESKDNNVKVRFFLIYLPWLIRQTLLWEGGGGRGGGAVLKPQRSTKACWRIAMGKDERKKKEDAPSIEPTRTLRDNGKVISNLSGLANTSTVKKMQHLHRLAVWAAGEVSIPPLGALLGARLAAAGEVLGIPPPDSPFFTCE